MILDLRRVESKKLLILHTLGNMTIYTAQQNGEEKSFEWYFDSKMINELFYVKAWQRFKVYSDNNDRSYTSMPAKTVSYSTTRI